MKNFPFFSWNQKKIKFFCFSRYFSFRLKAYLGKKCIDYSSVGVSV